MILQHLHNHCPSSLYHILPSPLWDFAMPVSFWASISTLPPPHFCPNDSSFCFLQSSISYPSRHSILQLLIALQNLSPLPLHYFDQRREDIIDQIELWSPQQVTHLPLCVGSFTSPGIYTRYKCPTAFSVSSERHWHWESGVKEIAKFPNGLSGIRTRDHSIVSRAL